MTTTEFDEKGKSIQAKIDKIFQTISNLKSPSIKDTEFFQAHVDRIKNAIEGLEKAQLEYRILMAEQYNLILPEQLDEEPEATEAVVEVQPQHQQATETMAEVTTAVAGVGALISLFRKARGR